MLIPDLFLQFPFETRELFHNFCYLQFEILSLVYQSVPSNAAFTISNLGCVCQFISCFRSFRYASILHQCNQFQMSRHGVLMHCACDMRA
jgi:hypothetical protein